MACGDRHGVLCWQIVQIVLVALDSALRDAWSTFCGDLEFVRVHEGSIFELECDAVVSPANSFGFMDGGIDMNYSQYFGWHVQERLQGLIRKFHHGELLVGSAEIVETDHPRFPYLIAAPTMRVPTILKNSVNPYLAARAVLILARYGQFRNGPLTGEPISKVVQSIAFPGLGTGVGQVGPNTCARQVRAAIDSVLLEDTAFPTSWSDAQRQHQLLYRDRVTDLQFEE